MGKNGKTEIACLQINQEIAPTFYFFFQVYLDLRNVNYTLKNCKSFSYAGVSPLDKNCALSVWQLEVKVKKVQHSEILGHILFFLQNIITSTVVSAIS